MLSERTDRPQPEQPEGRHAAGLLIQQPAVHDHRVQFDEQTHEEYLNSEYHLTLRTTAGRAGRRAEATAFGRQGQSGTTELVRRATTRRSTAVPQVAEATAPVSQQEHRPADGRRSGR